MKGLTLLTLAATLLVSARLHAVTYDVIGTIKADGQPSGCSFVKAFSNADCTGSTATGACDGNGNYTICDISFQPQSIYVYIDSCHFACFTLGMWNAGDKCGPIQSENWQAKNVNLITTCR